MKSTLRDFTLVLLATPMIAYSADRASDINVNFKPRITEMTVTPEPAWLNAPVTFSASCASASGNNKELTYTWSFGDGATEVTTVPTTVHKFTPHEDAGASEYEQYHYSVTCNDRIHGATVQTVSAQQELTVWHHDLTPVSRSTCSSGVQGFGWCWQNPAPTGNSLRGLAAVSTKDAWTVGDSGSVLETNDAGSTWHVRFLGHSIVHASLPDFISLKATDHNNAQLLAEDGRIFSTSDAGRHWVVTGPASPLALTAGVVTDNRVAWGVDGSGSVFRTNNAGTSWSNVVNQVDPTLQLRAITATGKRTAWAVGANSQNTSMVIHTTDGINWQTDGTLPQMHATLSSISANTQGRCGRAAAGSIWIGGFIPEEAEVPGFGVSIMRPLSGGNWSASPSDPLHSLYGGGEFITALDDQSAWATVKSPDVPPGIVIPLIRSTSSGNAQWTSWPSDSQPQLYAIDSNDCVHGWAVGFAGSILRTSDSANQWTFQNRFMTPTAGPETTPLVAVAAGSPRVAFTLQLVFPFLLPSHYELFGTIDGGQSWTSYGQSPRPLGQNHQVYSSPLGGISENHSAAVSTNSNGYTVAITRAMIAEVDPGQASVQSWDQASVKGYWTGASTCDNAAWVVDELGTVLRKAPLTQSPAKQPWTVAWQGPPSGAIGGPTNVVIRNGIPSINGALNGIAAVDVSSGAGDCSKKAVVIGDNGWISRTIDSGNSWTQVATGVTTKLTAIAFGTTPGTDQTGWIVGSAGTILKTNDGGATWFSQLESDATIDYVSVSAADARHAWAVGRPSGGCDTHVPCNWVVASTSDGRTWRLQDARTQTIFATAAADSSTAWIVGDGNSILKTVTGGRAPPPVY